MARKLIRKEGLLCGGSSGAAVAAAVTEAKCLKKGQKCVVMLPDSIRNYMTKHLKPSWCIERSLIEDFAPDGTSKWWFDSATKIPHKPSLDLDENMSINDALTKLREAKTNNAFITSKNERKGIASVRMILERIMKGRIIRGETVKLQSFLDEKHRPISTDQHVGLALRILEANSCVIVAKDGKWEYILEEDDVLQYILN